MKFQQLKLWPSRRVHLFQYRQDISFCGLAWRGAGDVVGRINWGKDDYNHPYDDLNYCQCCRRKAMGWNGEKYQPMTEKYDHLKKAYLKRKEERKVVKK